MLLAVMISVVSASVEVAPDAPCVDASFAQKLSSAGVVVPGDASLALRRVRAEVLEVTLTPRGAAPMRREVPAAARDCAGVDRVVVALVKAWLSSPVMRAGTGRDRPGQDGGAELPGARGTDGGLAGPARAVDAGARSTDAGAANEVDAGPRRAADVGGGSESTSSAGVDAGPAPPSGGGAPSVGVTTGERTPPVSSTGLDGGASETAPGRSPPGVGGRALIVDGGASETAPPRSPPGVGGRALIVDGGASETAPPGSPPGVGGPALVVDGGASSSDGRTGALDAGTGGAAPWRIGVGLLGGIASGTTTDIVPQGLLSVDVTRGWFGAALDVGLSGAVSRQVAPGTVTSSWQWLSVSARALWAPLQRVLLEVQLGLRGHRLVAVAAGYSETKPQQQLFSIGAVGSLGASVVIIGPVGLTVRATGVLKPPERFTIDNLGPVLDLGTLEGGVHAGVVARW